MKNPIKFICVCLIMVLTFTACNSKTTPTLQTTNTTTTYTTTNEDITTTIETTTEPTTHEPDLATTTVTTTTTTKMVTAEETESTTKAPVETTSTPTSTVPQTTKEVESANVKTMPTYEGPSSDELYTLELLNAEREKVGLPTLSFNYKLYNCARLRANETKEKLSHTRPNGTKYYTVLDDYNISVERCIGENIAYNYIQVDSAVTALMNSQSHKDNILHEKYTSVAIGIAELEDGYYTMVQLFEG